MKITLSGHEFPDVPADLLLLAATPEWKTGDVARLDRRLRGALISEATQQGFHGQEGETAVFQTHGSLPCRYVVLVGVGRGDGMLPWQRLAQHAVVRAQELRVTSVAIDVTPAFRTPEVVQGVAEGLRLASYSFDEFRSTPENRKPRLAHATLLAPPAHGVRAALARGEARAKATCYTRDLVNRPAGVVTPTYLAAEARSLGKKLGLRVRVLDDRALQRAGMGALLGVAQGSAQPARLIEMIYRPAGVRQPRVVAIAGKGVTFDSGGLSLKSAEGMQSMKRDMAGAAVVFGVMSALPALELKVEVRGYVAAAENMPSGTAIRPGDVLRACNGKTIEVLNTDAEGRLVLADALAHAAAAKPDEIIDFATLTGAVRTALGTRYAAILGTSPALVQSLIAAGRTCGENLWELPLVEEYRSDILSQVADLKNIGEGGAGTIIGGLFLREFVGDVPWAHVDFSSTVNTDKPQPGVPRGATGYGVRTVLQYLEGIGG